MLPRNDKMRLIGAILLGVARSGDQKISEIDERERVGASSLPRPPPKISGTVWYGIGNHDKNLLAILKKKEKRKRKTKD